MKRITKLPEGIEVLPIKEWKNTHENFTQPLVPNASFKLRLPRSKRSRKEKYKATTANMQWLIDYAIKHKIRLRALGSGWSLSKVGVTHGGLIDTKGLHLTFSMEKGFVEKDYLHKGNSVKDLLFAQCGNSILQLHSKLEKRRKRALKASGASNGQTIAGALSTGTHGGAFDFGAIPEYVVGLHLVVGPNRHVYLERASHPVVSKKFIDWIGAEHIRNDQLFDAALVSFGSFGFIHGVMIETEPIYLLEGYRQQLPYNPALMKNIKDFNLEALPLPHGVKKGDKSLYHFEMAVNPHDLEVDNQESGIYVRTIYKNPYREDYPRRAPNNNGFTYGDDTLGFMQTVLDRLGPLSNLIIPKLVNLLFPLAYNSEERSGPTWGTIGETFNFTSFRGRIASAAMGLDVKDVPRVLELLLKQNKKKPLAGAFAMRFVKQSSALLGFTKFPITCVLEMDGVDAKSSRKFFEKIWQTLEKENITYTLHWGKINFNLNPELLRRMYGEDKVDRWLESRCILLDGPTREVFKNDFIVKCGLDRVVEVQV